MKLSEIKENWPFIENIGSISYWLEQTDDGSGKTIGPEEVLEIGCQLEADRDEYRNLYHMGEAKITSREAIIGQLSEGELAKDVTRLEAENDELGKALNYYKTGAQQTSQNCNKPKYIPKRILLSKTIRSELSLSSLIALPGEYEAYCNQYGAVSLRTLGGELLGVKLDEFDVIEWQENPALITGEKKP